MNQQTTAGNMGLSFQASQMHPVQVQQQIAQLQALIQQQQAQQQLQQYQQMQQLQNLQLHLQQMQIQQRNQVAAAAAVQSAVQSPPQIQIPLSPTQVSNFGTVGGGFCASPPTPDLLQQAALHAQLLQAQLPQGGRAPQLQLPSQSDADDLSLNRSQKRDCGSPLSPLSNTLNATHSSKFGSDSDDLNDLSLKSRRPQKPWITPALIDVISQKKENYRNYTMNPEDPDAKKKHVEARKIAMKAVRKAKREYARKMERAKMKNSSKSEEGFLGGNIMSPEGLTSSTTSLGSHFSSSAVAAAAANNTAPEPIVDMGVGEISSNVKVMHDTVVDMLRARMVAQDANCPTLDDEEDEEDDLDDLPDLSCIDLEQFNEPEQQ